MNLNDAVKNIIQSNNYTNLCERLVIIRHDGICVFSNSADSFETASISALVSGLWQAAESLNGLMEGQFKFSDYRLAFDTSNHGLYILPVQFKNENYYLCSLYKEVSNPAKLKRELRVLKEELEGKIAKTEIVGNINRSGYLFKDITDEEIDKIFAVEGM